MNDKYIICDINSTVNMVTSELLELGIKGKYGDSLFYDHSFMVEQNSLNEWRTKIKSYFEKCESTNDHRAIALIGALIIEEELDKLLSSWLIDYKYINDDLEMTFSFKVKLAKSCNLIPNRILDSIEPIRKIRNIFAHNMEIDQFEVAKKHNKKAFDALYDKIKTFSKWNEKDDLKTFKTLVIYITTSLIFYTEYVTRLTEYIRDSNNLSKIMKLD